MIHGGLQQTSELDLLAGFSSLRRRGDKIDADNSRKKAFAQTGVNRLRDEPTSVDNGATDQLRDRPFATGPECAAPKSAMTIMYFVENVFVPEHVAMKGLSGRTHYQAILKHVLRPEEVNRVFNVDPVKSRAKLKAVPKWPYLGSVRLCDARPDDVQQLISAAVMCGYSTQTVTHIRNVVSSIFVLANKKRWFIGDNPASMVTLPEMTRKEAHTLTLAQAKEVIGLMQYPERELALIAILTGMNVAEICGLQWKHVNLTEERSSLDGEPIPARTIAVKKEWYRGELESVKSKSRNRYLSIPEPLLPILLELSHRAKSTGSDDFVLVSQAGTPVNEYNISVRRLKPLGKDLQIPWLSWQVLHRTHKRLAQEFGMQLFVEWVARDR